jgi:hypothetical protein
VDDVEAELRMLWAQWSMENNSSVVVPTADHWRNPEQREFFLSGLRLAAGEET